MATAQSFRAAMRIMLCNSGFVGDVMVSYNGYEHNRLITTSITEENFLYNKDREVFRVSCALRVKFAINNCLVETGFPIHFQ